MKEENNSVVIWFVVIGVILIMLLVSFTIRNPFAPLKSPVVTPTSQTSTDKTNTIIRETSKEVLITPEVTATASPSPIK